MNIDCYHRVEGPAPILSNPDDLWTVSDRFRSSCVSNSIFAFGPDTSAATFDGKQGVACNRVGGIATLLSESHCILSVIALGINTFGFD